MTQTIYTQEAGKYHVQKTVGGWIVVFIEDRYNFRNVDGGKVHKSRQNAYKKADRLNHPLKYIFKKHDAAEAYFDNYTAGVQYDKYDEEGAYSLYIQKEYMPPHYRKHFATLEEVEKEMMDSFFPQPIKWQAGKPEEI